MNEWQQLKDVLEINVLAWLPDDTKQKIVDSTRKAYNDLFIYEVQMRASSVCRQIETSRKVGLNEVIVPILLHEYAELLFSMKAIQLLLPMIKQTPAPINMVLDYVKPKSVSSWVYDDLQLLITHKDVKIDITMCMTIFKVFGTISNELILKAVKDPMFGANGFLHNTAIQKELRRINNANSAA